MSSEYIDQERKAYSLYVLQQRAIPHAADGLKAGARRVLWTARDGKKYKSASLAGATMPIHPHQAPEGAVNTLAAPYGNNIPLLDGDGAFGTLLNPTAYGASRYTSCKVSEFTKDVMFKDIEIVPMIENYDGTLMEPKHFLPLIPISLLNPSEGIAVGFASSILPRELLSIVNEQIRYMEKNEIHEDLPAFEPTNQWAQDWIEDKNGNVKYVFKGMVERIKTTEVRIYGLPYGLVHEKYIDFLGKLEDDDKIKSFEDNSRDKFDITVVFKKGFLRTMEDDDLLEYLGLINNVSENMNLIDFDGERVIKTNFADMIQHFTDWRLGFYKTRYERLKGLLEQDIQKYKDILRAIAKNVGGVAKKIQNRSELKAFLEEIGIVYIDYIADLPVYRFTAEEKEKVEEKLKQANETMKWYNKLLKSENERKKIYVMELKEILANRKKGRYN